MKKQKPADQGPVDMLTKLIEQAKAGKAGLVVISVGNAEKIVKLLEDAIRG